MKSDIVDVCTKRVSEINGDFADMNGICEDEGIPYLYVNDINSKESIDWIESLTPNSIFCFGCPSLIRKQLLELAPMGVVGFHPTNFPRNRGWHPLIWALALGMNSSESIFFLMGQGQMTAILYHKRNLRYCMKIMLKRFIRK